MKHCKRKNLKFLAKWVTTNGAFETRETVNAQLQIPEFIESTMVTHTFHIYQKIFHGRGVLRKLRTILNLLDPKSNGKV